MIITNLAGDIEYANPAFEEVSGYSRGEVIGRNPRLLKSGEQTRAIYAELWNTVLAGGVFRGTLINRKKNGECYYAEKSVSPVRDAQGGSPISFRMTGTFLTRSSWRTRCGRRGRWMQ